MHAQDDVTARLGTVGVLSQGIARIPNLQAMLGVRDIVFRPTQRQAGRLDAVVGWGHKPTAAAARAFAGRYDLPYLGLEDGLLRSASVNGKSAPLSLVVDDLGIYYDSTTPSRLEHWLAAVNDDPLSDPGLLARAASCRERIVRAGLSKYNHATQDPPKWLLEGGRPLVLVVDQTRGDASIELGGANDASFRRMLEAAVAEHPEATVVVKTHPDSWTQRKRCYLAQCSVGSSRVLAEPVDPAKLLESVERVYTVTSGLGFEALLRGVPVTCFGAPFYAGWGLTDDRVQVLRRSRTRSVDELVAAALIRYPRYVHPVTKQRCELEDAIDHLSLQREMFVKNRGRYYCFGFSSWKRRFIRHYLKGPQSDVTFVRSANHARRCGFDAQSRIVVWGSKQPAGMDELSTEFSSPVFRMEDGFLRSVGLGSDFTAPSSLVVDQRGLYYDPGKLSDLEVMLESAQFTRQELEQAEALREQIVGLRISKYNFGGAPSDALNPPGGRRVILVPGQVEDDASVLRGSQHVRTNGALLSEVRRQNPDAYIIYKPHPDVVSGNRRASGAPNQSGLYDCYVERNSISECLDVADEVHTLTSLVGFEALLRNLQVVAYGHPFYAGWGLTEDRYPIARRRRRLTLTELVAGVLLRYPRYYSWDAEAFTTAAHVVAELEAHRRRVNEPQPSSSQRGRRQLRRALALVRRVLDVA